jgi:cell volume regulation protein A
VSHVVELMASMAWVLGLGLLAARLMRATGVPDLVLYMLIGLLLGPQVLGLVHLPASDTFGQLMVTGGAAFMLYEGGRAIDIGVLRRIWIGTTLLATLGVLITGTVVCVAAHYLLGFSWEVSALGGAAMASTDPATIVPLFAQVRVAPRLRQLVIAESAFNDATSAVLTFTLLAIAAGQVPGAAVIGGTFLSMLLIGLGTGVAIGFLVQLLIAEGRRVAFFGLGEEHAVASLFAMLAAYVIAELLGGSGFMAVFVAGVVRGNGSSFGLHIHLERAASHDSFLALLGTAVRMLIFGTLGANVNLHLLGTVGLAGLGVVAALIFIGRPLTVFACLGPDRKARWSLREMLFTSWVRETGVVPAALASLLLASGAPAAAQIAALVFLAVLVTILLQGLTTAAWARRTGVAAHEPPTPLVTD